MGRDSLISWTDDTRNFWISCTEIPGRIVNKETEARAPSACDNCYARRENQDRWHRATWGKGEERWKCNLDDALRDMRKFNKLGLERGYPRLVFLNSASDAMDEEVPDTWRDEMIFEGVAPHPGLIGLVLTKRVAKLIRYVRANLHRLPRNLAFGVTVATADDLTRLDQLASLRRFIPWPVVLFASIEPLLGPIDIYPWLAPQHIRDTLNRLISGMSPSAFPLPAHLAPRFIDWALVGGESGYDLPLPARPVLPTASAWIDPICDHCVETGTAFHMKQWGEYAPLALFPDAKGQRRYVPIAPKNPRWWDDPLETTVTSERENFVEAFVRVGHHRAGRTFRGREWLQFPKSFNRPEAT